MAIPYMIAILPVTEEYYFSGTMVGAQAGLLQINFQGWHPGHQKCTKIIAVAIP